MSQLSPPPTPALLPIWNRGTIVGSTVVDHELLSLLSTMRWYLSDSKQERSVPRTNFDYQFFLRQDYQPDWTGLSVRFPAGTPREDVWTSDWVPLSRLVLALWKVPEVARLSAFQNQPHVLVAEASRPPRVCFADGNAWNCRMSNLVFRIKNRSQKRREKQGRQNYEESLVPAAILGPEAFGNLIDPGKQNRLVSLNELLINNPGMTAKGHPLYSKFLERALLIKERDMSPEDFARVLEAQEVEEVDPAVLLEQQMERDAEMVSRLADHMGPNPETQFLQQGRTVEQFPGLTAGADSELTKETP